MKEKTAEQIQKELRAPFMRGDVPALLWRVQSKKQGVCTPYITAQMCRDRMDEVFGIDGWEIVSLEELHNTKGIMCTIRAKITGEWVSRTETGEPNADAREARFEGKAMTSDAFKRTCAAFGVGAYIKDIPNYHCVMAGSFPTTRNLQDASKPGSKVLKTPKELTSYINAQGPYRFALLDVFEAMPKELRDKHSEVLKEIYNAI